MSAPVGRRALLVGGGGLLLSGCVGGGGESLGTVALGGGDAGGAFIQLSRLLARELEETGRVRQATVVPSAGAAENLQLVTSGQADVAPVFADSDGLVGGGTVVAVAKAYETMLHCLVRGDSDVQDLRDLVGRPLAIGPAGSGTAATAERLLRRAGVEEGEPGAWVRQRVGDGAIALAGGAVEALFWWGGRPAPEIRSLVEVARFRPLDLGRWVGSANLDSGDVYRTVRVPAEFYDVGGLTTLGTSCLLGCRRDADARLVRAIVETVARDGSALVPQPSNGLRFFAAATLYDTGAVPLHPAAVRAYRALHG